MIRLKRLVLPAVVLMAAACTAGAQTTTENTPTMQERFSYSKTGEKYFGNEFTIDAFGAYTSPFNNFGDMFDRSWRHGSWGGGAGLNYFINKYVGMGADTVLNERGRMLNNVSGSLILRLPLGESGLAPYIFAGGGGRFDVIDEATGHTGVGLEFRFNRHFGIFTDARFSWADKTSNAALVKAGLRFGF